MSLIRRLVPVYAFGVELDINSTVMQSWRWNTHRRSTATMLPVNLAQWDTLPSRRNWSVSVHKEPLSTYTCRKHIGIYHTHAHLNVTIVCAHFIPRTVRVWNRPILPQETVHLSTAKSFKVSDTCSG